jgi:hypothetical protein
MEAVFRGNPEESAEFFTRMCKWGIFIGGLNISSLSYSLWVFSSMRLKDADDIITVVLCLVKIITTMIQLPCKISMNWKLEEISLQLERLVDLDRVRDAEVRNGLRNAAIQNLIGLQNTLAWRLNHRLGKYSLFWIFAASAFLIAASPKTFFALLLKYNLWFNIAVLVANFLKTAFWLNAVLPDLGFGGKFDKASEAEIQQKTFLRTYSSDNYDIHQCPICLEEYNEGTQIRILRCNHIYHDNCIVSWLKSQGACPYCKQPI